ncbi:MAG: hypothetical protein ACOY82_13755 [Pseudomonadota bacterium]
MQRWLLHRLFSEDQPSPHFAFYGTVNWMRSLRLLVADTGFSAEDLGRFYGHVERRPANRSADTLVFESIFLAFNHLAGLLAITEANSGYDVCRPAISSWYNCVHASAAAMVAAFDGEHVDNSGQLAVSWQELINSHLILMPFSPATSTLVKADADSEIEALRQGNSFDLSQTASNASEALGGAISYLHGTVKFEREHMEEVIKNSAAFLELGMVDFRKKVARELRDSRLSTRPVNFISQATRYAGKANFRDSIFLSYGDDHESEIDRFLTDIGDVAEAFLTMASVYCSKRTEAGAWDAFVDDIEANSRVSLAAALLRV